MAKWDDIQSSGDVEDRRGMSPGGIALSGVGGLVLFLAFMFLGGGENASVLEQVLGQVAEQQTGTTQTEQPEEFKGADQYETFTKKVLGSNNDTWSGIFTVLGRTYEPPKLVLFRQMTQSGCGAASTEVGPHYCPEDQTIYLD